MFEIGDIVLYGTQGIWEIDDISTIDIHGVDKKRLYYILRQKDTSGTIYVPVDGNTSKIKKMVSKKEAMEMISQIPDIEPLKLSDAKKPEPEYKEVLRGNDCRKLLSLIKCIYFRKMKRLEEGKKVTAVDEKYMKLAEGVLYQELGTVLDISEVQVLDYITNMIESIQCAD